jgi:hypothetical protein
MGDVALGAELIAFIRRAASWRAVTETHSEDEVGPTSDELLLLGKPTPDDSPSQVGSPSSTVGAQTVAPAPAPAQGGWFSLFGLFGSAPNVSEPEPEFEPEPELETLVPPLSTESSITKDQELEDTITKAVSSQAQALLASRQFGLLVAFPIHLGFEFEPWLRRLVSLAKHGEGDAKTAAISCLRVDFDFASSLADLDQKLPLVTLGSVFKRHMDHRRYAGGNIAAASSLAGLLSCLVQVTSQGEQEIDGGGCAELTLLLATHLRDINAARAALASYYDYGVKHLEVAPTEQLLVDSTPTAPSHGMEIVGAEDEPLGGGKAASVWPAARYTAYVSTVRQYVPPRSSSCSRVCQ